MPKKDRRLLKSFFETGDVPTQSNFEDLIDSGLNQVEDGLEKTPGAITIYTQKEPRRPLLYLDQFKGKAVIGENLPENHDALLHVKEKGLPLSLDGDKGACLELLYAEGYNESANEGHKKGLIGFTSNISPLEIVNQKAGSNIHFYTRTEDAAHAEKRLTISPAGQVGVNSPQPKASLQIGSQWTFEGSLNPIIGYNNYVSNAQYRKFREGASSQLKFDNGWISIGKGEDDHKGANEMPLFTSGQLKVGGNKSAFISAGNIGALFGANLYIDADLNDRNSTGRPRQVFKTVETSNDNAGYAAMHAFQGKLSFYTHAGDTTAGEKVSINQSLRMLVDEEGRIGIGEASPKANLHVNGDICGKGMLLLSLAGFDNNASILMANAGERFPKMNIPFYLPKGVNRAFGKIKVRAIVNPLVNPSEDRGFNIICGIFNSLDSTSPFINENVMKINKYVGIIQPFDWQEFEFDLTFSGIPANLSGDWKILKISVENLVTFFSIRSLILYADAQE